MEPRIQYAKTEDGVSIAFTAKLPEVVGGGRGRNNAHKDFKARQA